MKISPGPIWCYKACADRRIRSDDRKWALHERMTSLPQTNMTNVFAWTPPLNQYVVLLCQQLCIDASSCGCSNRLFFEGSRFNLLQLLASLTAWSENVNIMHVSILFWVAIVVRVAFALPMWLLMFCSKFRDGTVILQHDGFVYVKHFHRMAIFINDG